MRRLGTLQLICIILAMQILIFMPTINVVAEIPEPFGLYGVVRDEYGVVLSNGQPVRSFVDGVMFSNKTSVFSRPGFNDGYFSIDTYGNHRTNLTDPGTPWIKEGADEGEQIMYLWGDMSNNTPIGGPSKPWLTGIVFKEIYDWHTGLPAQAGDLNASPMILQPPLIKIWTIVTNSTYSPYNDYLWLCNPTPNAVEASTFYIQKDVPGNISGPVVQIPAGIISPYGFHFVDLATMNYFVETGDNVKLVWKNNLSQPSAPYGGNDIIVDRVEFNASTGGSLYWEPGNTIQKDEIAPSRGFAINRSYSCSDTNSAQQDFFLGIERPPSGLPPWAPWPLKINTISSDNNNSAVFHITTLSNFTIGWYHNDPNFDAQTEADVAISLGLNRTSVIWNIIVPGSNQSVLYNGSTLQSCTTYYLSVKTKDATRYGPLADWMFRTNCLPTGLNNLAPLDGTLLPPSIGQLVWWSQASDANPEDSINYTWQVTQDVTFTSIEVEGTTQNNYSDSFQTDASATYYWRVMASDGWESIPFTAPWLFYTGPPIPPSVTLQNPAGGEYWAGGSTHQVNWTAFDPDTLSSDLIFYLNYSSSVSSGNIAGPLVGATSYQWTLPFIDASDVIVNITVVDRFGSEGWDESGQFTIDSKSPSVVDYSPKGWNVPLNTEVIAVFDELIDVSSGQMNRNFGLLDEDAGKWVSFTWYGIPPGPLSQELHFVPSSPLKMCGNYKAFLNSTFVDRVQWNLINPVSWIFHTICPPTISLLSNIENLVWTGGSNHIIMWSMSDEIDSQLRVWINYSIDGGVDNFPYSSYSGILSTGMISHPWTVPLVDTTAARIRIVVQDISGLIAFADSGNFTIDSTPPSILTSVPAHGSYGVKTTPDIQVVFDEPVVKASAEQAFSINPNPGDISFSWSTTGSGIDILIVSHKPFKSHTDYVVTFSTTLRDVSDPGNHPITPLTIRFSTKPPPDVNPPRALAVGKRQVEVGEPVRLDGSGSTGNITRYVWTITDRQGHILDVLRGVIVNYTFKKTGRYAVTLTVYDDSTNLSDDDTIEIVVTSKSDTLLIILLISAIMIGAFVGGTEIGRFALFVLFAAPVYRRKIKGKEDPEIRGMIRGYIRVHPGDTYTDIKRNLGLNNGCLTYHLIKLEKKGLIKSRVQGTRKRYYPKGMQLPKEDGGELHDIERRLLETVKEEPGISVSILAEHVGVSRQLALYHVRKLSRKGKLMLERRRLHLKIFPREKRNA